MNIFDALVRKMILGGVSFTEIPARLASYKQMLTIKAGAEVLKRMEETEIPESQIDQLVAEMCTPGWDERNAELMTTQDKITAMSSISSHILAERYGTKNDPSWRFNAKLHDYLVGTRCWPHSYKKGPDERTAMENLVAWADSLPTDDLGLLLRTSEGQVDALYAVRWADQGFPVVRLHGHKYAAALLSTSPGKGLDVRAPWKAFLIEIPSGLLFVENDNHFSSINWLRVFTHECSRTGGVGWSFCGVSDVGVQLRRVNLLVEELLEEPEQEGGLLGSSAYSLELSDQDQRLQKLLGRLVVNTCLAMSDPSNVKSVGKAGQGSTKRTEDEPVFRSFILGKPVQVDCRQALKDYVEGERRNPLAVQFLVRGHWRQQAFGPQHSQRKTIWIEPFWKGPEDSPINMRPHNLG